MAVPSVASYTENDTENDGAISVTKPSGVSADDGLLIFVASDPLNPGTGVALWTPPSGWSEEEDDGQNIDVSIAVYSRVATGSEGSSESVDEGSGSITNKVGFYLRITGIDTGDFIHAKANVTTQVSDSFSTNTLTTSVDDCLIVSFCGFDGGDGAPFSISGGDHSKLDDHTSGTAGGVAGCVATGSQASAGTTTACTFTAQNADGYITIQLAIAPGTVQLSTPTLEEIEGTIEDEMWFKATNLDTNANQFEIQHAPDVGGSPGSWSTQMSGALGSEPYFIRDPLAPGNEGDIIWIRMGVQDSTGTYTDSDWSTGFAVQIPYAPPSSISIGKPLGSGPFKVEVTLNSPDASATHEVWRAPDPGNDGDYQFIGEMPAGDTKFTDLAAPSDDMWYKVRASSPGDATSSFTSAVQASPVGIVPFLNHYARRRV